MTIKLSGQMKEVEISKQTHDIRVNTKNGNSILHCIRCGAVFGKWESNAQISELKQQKCGALVK